MTCNIEIFQFWQKGNTAYFITDDGRVLSARAGVFPENYILFGTQAEQKKFLGNAVEVNMSRVLCESLCAAVS